MALDTPSFAFEFKPGTIRFGRGHIDGLDETLAGEGLESAMVVCGQTVGATDAVIDPVKAGLGDRLTGVFDKTTTAKTLSTVFDGIEQFQTEDADAIVAVGGGSSIDVARGISALARADRTLTDARSEILESGELTLPVNDDAFVPILAVPTTMAGADLSVAAGLVAETEEGSVEAIPVDTRLMPTALVYDPDLFETTPMDILTASAINGFDKGVEAIYSRFANPVTDATAVRGLRYLRSSLPHLRESAEPEVMERAVAGTLLVQYGVSMPDQYKINVVHAFGHALRNQFGIQQGAAHGVIVPHALELIFAEGGGRPDVLADGLVTGEENADTTEAAIVEAVRTVRDGLGLPSRLRDIQGTMVAGLRAVAEHTAEDAFLEIGPAEFDPTVDDIERALRDAW
ncbi:iron-containing alcohol dehydrogenase family protein [Natrinema sp. DC36]|uniref:iron-containing alcohol dehydrogenase family protein n=1 Tax=Natrinema sp. DC36 TaxID=2878680 RepID=UPI001CEFE7B9|nr:iron-containing alcohol dehydrogenase family protein [Natrinema sp. DC36]